MGVGLDGPQSTSVVGRDVVVMYKTCVSVQILDIVAKQHKTGISVKDTHPKGTAYALSVRVTKTLALEEDLHHHHWMKECQVLGHQHRLVMILIMVLMNLLRVMVTKKVVTFFVVVRIIAET